MEEQTPVNLTQYSFDDFVAFLFARDVPEDPENAEPWYFDFSYSYGEMRFAAAQVCAYYVQLFSAPEFLLGRFSKGQLEQGFWAILGPNLDCSAHGIILDSDLPFEAKSSCIASMFDLFSRLFATEPLDSSVQMWWDSFCYDWHSGNRKRERGGEDLLLQDAFFQTLSRILSLDSDICQGAALHGLGHLHHPETKELVGRFLRERPTLSKEMREYALAAAEFKVI